MSPRPPTPKSIGTPLLFACASKIIKASPSEKASVPGSPLALLCASFSLLHTIITQHIFPFSPRLSLQPVGALSGAGSAPLYIIYRTSYVRTYVYQIFCCFVAVLVLILVDFLTAAFAFCSSSVMYIYPGSRVVTKRRSENKTKYICIIKFRVFVYEVHGR